MKSKPAFIFLGVVVCWPVGGHADQNLQARFRAALKDVRSVTNVEVKWLDTAWFGGPALLRVVGVKQLSRTFQYSFIASGQRFRATCRLMSSTKTNQMTGRLEFAFDGKTFVDYDAGQRRMTTGTGRLPGSNAESADNPLVAPFKFLTKYGDKSIGYVLRFTDIASGGFANGFTLPPAQESGGLLELSMPGLPLGKKPTMWKIAFDNAGDAFAPKMITFIAPGSKYEEVDRLLAYTNLGAYRFPSRTEWTTTSYPPTTPPTLLVTGLVTLVSASMPEHVPDSEFELKRERGLADSILNLTTKSFERVAPSYPAAHACAPDLGPEIYDEAADGSKQIDAAIAVAKSEAKRVLVDFGANWSNPSQRFYTFSKTDQSAASELRNDYVTVMVDINREHNREIELKYGHPIHFGLPAIVILDSNGKRLARENPVELPETGEFSSEKTLDFLRKWARERSH